jgi:hypothetical protein
MGIAARRGIPSQKKSGVYIIAPPSPSIEKRTAIRNAIMMMGNMSMILPKHIEGLIMLGRNI